MPNIELNWLAIGACVIAAMPVGFLWFGPVFGKAWAKEMGMNIDDPPSGITNSTRDVPSGLRKRSL